MKASAVALALLLFGANALGSKRPFCALSGRVQVVSSSATYRVRIVNTFGDAKVRRVSSLPSGPGEWQIVDTFPAFTVQFVTSGEDFTVEWSQSFAGCD